MNNSEKIKVLLIEDNPGDARLLEIMLSEVERNPVVLQHVSTLNAALEYLHPQHTDLILLDLSLPDGNGLESIKKIQNVDHSLPIIILTGLDSQDFALTTVHHGAQDYLIKGQGDGHLMIRAIRYAIERKQIEHRLTSLAHFDSLTGLANREYFNITLERSIQQCERKTQTLGLMFLDLDHFKEINDTLGHLSGDQLLVSVAERLKGCVRNVDFIARLGGDEFTIILEAVQSPKIIMSIAEKILHQLSKPFQLSEREVFISSSIGITIFPDDSKNAHDLLKYADVAMYQAKNKGRNNFQFYTPELNDEAVKTIDLKNELRNAVNRQQLELYYQPKINVQTNKIISAEALLRWRHPKRGLISPLEFIPIAEQSGLIHSIGKWVIKEAFSQLKVWQQHFYDQFSMAINLSVKQFQSHGLVDFIASELASQFLSAEHVELEITESILMQNNQQEQLLLQELSKLGFKISLDDFGTGYSSLSYLKRYTIDVLKIDRSFIRDITSDPDDAAIVRAIVAMAHALKLRVIAEGVENADQLAYLQELNCDQIQGYLISCPLKVGEFEQLLEQHYAQ